MLSRSSDNLNFQNFRLIGGNSHGLQQSQSGKWFRWKEAEEKKLRELGVDEETIQRLHTYDWAQFNKERQYRQRQVDWSPYVEWSTAQDLELPVEDTKSLLDSIEDTELLRVLSKEDKLTIQIAFLKMSGFNGYEIAEKTGLTQKAVNLRMVRLRKKLKKFLEA
jgi:hypothetical protein